MMMPKVMLKWDAIAQRDPLEQQASLVGSMSGQVKVRARSINALALLSEVLCSAATQSVKRFLLH
jgi:hypothetical protein